MEGGRRRLLTSSEGSIGEGQGRIRGKEKSTDSGGGRMKEMHVIGALFLDVLSRVLKLKKKD